MNKVCRCHKEKIRTEEEHKLLTNRLKRIEGQVRGIIKMVDENAYCPDILIQVSAIKSALGQNSLGAQATKCIPILAQPTIKELPILYRASPI